MAIEVTEVDKHQDWDELFACFWTAWANPPQVVGQLTFPHIGESTGHESKSFRERKRLWLEATINNPNDYWGKAVDTETLEIVGGVGITFHEESPPQEKIRAEWWEEGSEMRELAEEMFERILEMRRVLMRGPHATGERLWCLPAYRNKVVAEKLVRWATEKIDSRGVEACLEATVFSKPVLQRYGFMPVRNAKMNFPKKDASEQWNRMVRELQEVPVCIMWRPRCALLKEGETVIPGKEYPKAKL